MITTTANSPASLSSAIAPNESLLGWTVPQGREPLPVVQVFRAPGSPIAEIAVPTSILLADDEIDLWWPECLAALAQSGCHVDTAEDGESAWDALHANTYDLLITDNKMPKVWGVELIKKLRVQGITLPIILASSLLPMIGPELKPHFVDVHLLEKPVSPSKLFAMLALASPRAAMARGSSVPLPADSPAHDLRNPTRQYYENHNALRYSTARAGG